MLGVAILTALLASLATLAVQLLLLLRFLSTSSSTSSPPTTYPPRGPVTTRHPRLLSLLRGAGSASSSAVSPLSPGSPASSSTTSATTTSSSTSSAAAAAATAAPATEACRCLNALLLSVFSELRGSAELRAWVTRKIRVEMLELLQSRTAGRLVEGLSLRDVSLGDALPVFHGVRTLLPPARATAAKQPGEEDSPSSSPPSSAELPDELELEADVEYTGGCYVCVHAELVFGKRAELFVRIARVRGPLRVRVTRAPPLAHWSFAFTRDPRAELEVRSHYEGRPMPQLTTVIVNQIKKVLRRKHTLPSYKIRYKPFFPSHAQGDSVNTTLPEAELKRGTLKVQLVACSRLLLPTAPDRECDIYCSLELADKRCTGAVRFFLHEIQISKGTSPLIGLTFRQISVPDGDADLVVVATVVPNTPAASADVRKDDRVVSIAGHKVYTLAHAGKLLASADPVKIELEREEFPTGAVFSNQPAAGAPVIAPAVKSLQAEDSADPDSDFEDLFVGGMNETPVADESPRSVTVGSKQPPVPAAAAAAAAMRNNSPGGSPSHSAKPREAAASSSAKVPKPGESWAAECPRGAGDTNAGAPDPADATAGGTSNPVRPPVPPRPKTRPEPAATNADGGAAAAAARIAKDGVEPSAKQAARPDAACPEEPPPARGNDRPEGWTSTKAVYGNNACAWAEADGAEFRVEGHHRYLNVLVWWQEPAAPGAQPANPACVGHASVAVEEIVSECLDTGSLQFYRTYLLRPPDPKPAALLARPHFKQLASHKGFDEDLCFGEVTVHFMHSYGEGFGGAAVTQKAQSEARRAGSPEGDVSDSEREDAATRAEAAPRHDFRDALFQHPTNCDYCKNQIWTNSGSRCGRCAYVCHKKCREKYQAERPRCCPPDGVRARHADQQRPQSMHKAAALARNLIPYARKRLQLRPGAKRPGEDGPAEQTAQSAVCEVDAGGGGGGIGGDAEEICEPAAGTAERKAHGRTGGGGGRGAGGESRGLLHDSVFVAVKEIGRALYRDLPGAERQQKLELMLEKLQSEIEAELERNRSLKCDLEASGDAAAAAAAEPPRATVESIALEVRKSNERLQALTLLLLHYRAGLEDLELAGGEVASRPDGAAEEAEREPSGAVAPTGGDDGAGGEIARSAEGPEARPQCPLVDAAPVATATVVTEEDRVSLRNVDVEGCADERTSAPDPRLERAEEPSESQLGEDAD